MMFYIYLILGIIVSPIVLVFILTIIQCIWRDATGKPRLTSNNNHTDADCEIGLDLEEVYKETPVVEKKKKTYKPIVDVGDRTVEL